MPRYRRLPLSQEESWASALTSIAIGAGVAAATWYLTRLYLSRDALDEPTSELTEAADRPVLADGREA